MPVKQEVIDTFYNALSNAIIQRDEAAFTKALNDIKDSQQKIMQATLDQMGIFDEDVAKGIIEDCGIDDTSLVFDEPDLNTLRSNAKLLQAIIKANQIVEMFSLDAATKHDIDNVMRAGVLFLRQEGDQVISKNETLLMYGWIINQMNYYLDHSHLEYKKLDNNRSYSDPDKNLLRTLKEHSFVTSSQQKLQASNPDNSETKLWEMQKFLYGTGTRLSDEIHKYLRPLMESAIIIANQGKLNLYYSDKGNSLLDTADYVNDGEFSSTDLSIIITGGFEDCTTGTIIHELTHCIDHNLTNTNTYFSEHNPTLKNALEALRVRYNQNPQAIDKIFTDIFKLYPDDRQPEEMLVRGFELMARQKNGLDIIRQQAPELLEFYDREFLPLCKSYIEDNKHYLTTVRNDYEETGSESSSVFVSHSEDFGDDEITPDINLDGILGSTNNNEPTIKRDDDEITPVIQNLRSSFKPSSKPSPVYEAPFSNDKSRSPTK
jgi:hypothetical protein